LQALEGDISMAATPVDREEKGGTIRLPSNAQRYLPIERHAVIGDRRTAAVTGADGRINWWCLPNFDGNVVFGALLDAERGGCWELGPEPSLLGHQEYIDDTAVARTTWSTEGWELELTDAMLWPERSETDPNAGRRVLLRRLRCAKGEAPCAMALVPCDALGAPSAIKGAAGWVGSEEHHADWLGWWISDPVMARQMRESPRATFRLQQGQCLWTVLGVREDPDVWNEHRAETALNDTIAVWGRWSSKHPFWGPRRDAVLRSVRTIRLLSFEPSGSQVAAPTCSLPEKIGSNRNYDYRYAWIRDSSLALAILAVFGDLDAAERYMDWLAKLDTSNEMPIQVVYGINGEHEIPERQLDDFEGYCASRPVRFGNQAAKQFQLDSLGYFADCALIYLQQGGKWKPEYWHLIARIAEFTAINWQRKDNGIWELDEMRHYVSSKAMSWVVLERASRIATELGSIQVPAHWKTAMEQIHADVMQRGWSEPLQAFRQHYESDDLDASVLLLATMGFLPADHPRIVSTVAAIRRHLERDGFVWRFHPGSVGKPDLPLNGLEGAFLPCTFWLASTLARSGQHEEAKAILDRVDKAFGQLGIYPEEIDPDTGAALGNMPMIFSHAEHLKAVMDYAKSGSFTFLEMAMGKMARKLSGVFRSA
jgi:GH15 family glucan-1,4-alpha-glucosidase